MNEKILKEGAATRVRNGVGGKLYLTSQKLSFKGHDFNIGEKEFEVGLEKISDVSAKGINKLCVLFKDGTREDFRVYGKDVWVDIIKNTITLLSNNLDSYSENQTVNDDISNNTKVNNKCPECNYDVNDTINQCFHCGYVLKKNINNSNSEIENTVNDDMGSNINNSTRYETKINFGVYIICCLIIIFFIYFLSGAFNFAILIICFFMGATLLVRYYIGKCPYCFCDLKISHKDITDVNDKQHSVKCPVCSKTILIDIETSEFKTIL